MTRPPVTPLLAALLALVLAAPAAAETEVDDDGPITVRITKADCMRLVKHRPDPGVEYEPGVDVHGDPVAPADLYGGSEIELPETVTIPIEVDLFDAYGLPPDQRYEGDVAIGTVEVDLDTGRASFDGEPLTPEAQHELAVRCQEILRDGE